MKTIAAVLLAVCLSIVCLSAGAVAGTDTGGFFCPDLGVQCWRRLSAGSDQGLMNSLRNLWSPKGDYMGTIILDQGQCGGFRGCAPCDAELAEADWDCQCNARYAECQGECFHR